MRSRAILALASVTFLAALPAVTAYAKKKDAPEARQFQQQISKDQRIEQALNRLTFGPRPGDAARVKAAGLKVWIDQQLHSEAIAENPDLLAKLKLLDTLTMTASEMVREYPSQQMLKQMAAGQMALPTDPTKRMMIQKRLVKLEKGQDGPMPFAPPDPAMLRSMLTDEEIRALRQGTPEQRIGFFASLPIDKQDDIIQAMPGVRQVVATMGPPELRRRVELLAGPQQVVYRDLAEAKVLRAVYSNRQLEEQLDDFWYNHFNVFADKGAVLFLVYEYYVVEFREKLLF
jgi:hypothetical protein